jgi:AraC-like DNA-binding protein
VAIAPFFAPVHAYACTDAALHRSGFAVGPPLLLASRGGTLELALGGRVLRIDEDNWTLLHGSQRLTHLRAVDRAARPMCVALPHAEAPPRIVETLHPRCGAVARHLDALEAALDAGGPDQAGWHWRTEGLCAEVQAVQQRLFASADALGCVKRATRLELMRRLLLAADFVQTHFDQPIGLPEIAAAASLSRFHLQRLFQRFHGSTPRRYLLVKRLAVARRLLADPAQPLDLTEIALRTGFGSRSSLFRDLRRELGCGGLALRRQARPATVPPDPEQAPWPTAA